MISSFESFNDAIRELDKRLGNTIKSTKHERNPDRESSQRYVLKEYNHGTLSSNLPLDIASNIRYAKTNIIPVLENFYAVMTVSEIFKSNIYDSKAYFKMVIEAAVYNSMDLDSIIKAQEMIAVVIDRMQNEIKQVDT